MSLPLVSPIVPQKNININKHRSYITKLFSLDLWWSLVAPWGSMGIYGDPWGLWHVTDPTWDRAPAHQAHGALHCPRLQLPHDALARRWYSDRCRCRWTVHRVYHGLCSSCWVEGNGKLAVDDEPPRICQGSSKVYLLYNITYYILNIIYIYYIYYYIILYIEGCSCYAYAMLMLGSSTLESICGQQASLGNQDSTASAVWHIK